MSEESGEFDARDLRKKRDHSWPSWLAPVLITLVGAIFTYGITSGQNNQRMTELERRSQEQAAATQALASQVANHEVKIAVISEKLDTIISQLRDVNEKLEHAPERPR